MLRLAADPSEPLPGLEVLYPGRDIEVAEWEKCLDCDQEVDGYFYEAGVARGYCFAHYDRIRYAQPTT